MTRHDNSKLAVLFRLRTFAAADMAKEGEHLDQLDAARRKMGEKRFWIAYRAVDRRYDRFFDIVRGADEAITAMPPTSEAHRDMQLQIAVERSTEDDEQSIELIHRVMAYCGVCPRRQAA